tara:strand:+ start:4874 stop:5536 length:663 start_codon:yes stop_codon:yes gene_type:complete
MKYLIAEDEIDLQQSIVTYLQRDGNICEVASDFKEASEKTAIYDYDIIILDLNLVSGSGLDILKTLKKEKKKAGVIIISANNSLTDKLEGLDLGADDYITKPFHLAELNARINAVLRRGKYGGDEIIEFNEIRIDTKSRTAYIDEKEIVILTNESTLTISNFGEKALINPENLFLRFYRESKEKQSTGLGLAIVKKICDFYGFSLSYHHKEQKHFFFCNL